MSITQSIHLRKRLNRFIAYPHTIQEQKLLYISIPHDFLMFCVPNNGQFPYFLLSISSNPGQDEQPAAGKKLLSQTDRFKILPVASSNRECIVGNAWDCDLCVDRSLICWIRLVFAAHRPFRKRLARSETAIVRLPGLPTEIRRPRSSAAVREKGRKMTRTNAGVNCVSKSPNK